MMRGLRLRYGLHWPTHRVPTRFYWRCLFWLAALLLAGGFCWAAPAGVQQYEQLAGARLRDVSWISWQWHTKMWGAPCTLKTDYVDGKCVDVDLKPIEGR